MNSIENGTGSNHRITHKGGIPVVVIPFKVKTLAFYLEISIKLINDHHVAQGVTAVEEVV